MIDVLAHHPSFPFIPINIVYIFFILILITWLIKYDVLNYITSRAFLTSNVPHNPNAKFQKKLECSIGMHRVCCGPLISVSKNESKETSTDPSLWVNNKKIINWVLTDSMTPISMLTKITPSIYLTWLYYYSFSIFAIIIIFIICWYWNS